MFNPAFQSSVEHPLDDEWHGGSLAFTRHAFGLNASRRGEEVTQDEASGTSRPTFKTLPLDDEVQIPSHLREQMLPKHALAYAPFVFFATGQS